MYPCLHLDRFSRKAAAAAAAAAAAGESTSATPTKQTGRQAEPMDMMDSGNNNNTANVVQQEKELTASRAKTPKTPSRKSRKRATRAGEDESARDGGGGDGKDVSGRGEEAGTPEEPKTKRSRRSSARGSKKASPDDPASGKGERSTGQDAKPQDGNGAVTTMDESSAGKGEGKGDDPMDVGEGAAPPSEPVSTAVKSLADAAEAMEEGVEKVQEEGKGGGAAEPVTIRVDNFVRPFTAPQAKKVRRFVCVYLGLFLVVCAVVLVIVLPYNMLAFKTSTRRWQSSNAEQVTSSVRWRLPVRYTYSTIYTTKQVYACFYTAERVLVSVVFLWYSFFAAFCLFTIIILDDLVGSC